MPKTKNEIDKEVMFRKIMPTIPKPSAPAQPQSVEEKAPAKQESPTAVQKPIFANENVGVQFREKSPLVVVNVMEQLVVEKLEPAFAKFNCCKCDKCKKDVAAIALNKLRPKYVVMEQGQIQDYLAKQAAAEVTAAVVQAILVVRAHPRH